MSINDLSDKELLSLAQETRKLAKWQYDHGKSSVHNYVKINKFSSVIKEAVIYRVPFTLMYMHYIDWMKKNYPQILITGYSDFMEEAKGYFNVLTAGHHQYALLKNHLIFRKYDHEFNNTVYKAAMRKKRRESQRNQREKNKKTYKKS